MERYFDINEQGFSIRCKLYCKEPSLIKRIVIFGHGFGGHKDNKAAARFADGLISKKKDFGVIVFNWPCHGDDCRNKLLLQDCLTYLGCVIEYAKRQYQTDEIYGNATSFGGYIFLKYIYENGNPFKKIALRAPAIVMHKVMSGTIIKDEDYLKLNKGKDVLVGFDRKIKINNAFLDDLRANDITDLSFIDYADDILILHGTKDEIVPYKDSEDFSENNIIELIGIENADHRFQDPVLMDLANKYILEFYDILSL